MTHVLLVNADPIFRASLSGFLEHRGYIPHEASSAQDALHILRSSAERYVVLLDMLTHDPFVQSQPSPRRTPRHDAADLLWAVESESVLSTKHVYGLIAEGPIPRAFQPIVSRLGLPVIQVPVDTQVVANIVAQLAERVNQTAQ